MKSGRIGLALNVVVRLLWVLPFGACAPSLFSAEPVLLVTEFMAANGSTLADQDGDYSDWIEIYNAGGTSVNLDHWYLTDNPLNRAKWRFPETELLAGDYLVVFASGKDRAAAGSELHTNFSLDSSGEYLALVKANGKTIAWEYDFTNHPQFEDASYGLDAALNPRYFVAPTPGSANGVSAADLGPIVTGVDHTPSVPRAQQSMAVTATLKRSLPPIGRVTLHYRVMYGDIYTMPMYDDGMHGDGAAGDGTYGAVLPSTLYGPGQMVRYYVTATDAKGHSSRWPLFHDPANSPEYLGTAIADPDFVSLLPTLHWFVEDPAAVETAEGTRASLFYGDLARGEGAFYDNVFVRTQGYASQSWPKKSFRFDLNQGHHFRFSSQEDPVEEFSLKSAFIDRAYIRQILAWETYRDAGTPYSISFPMRVQQNGAFFGMYTFVEQVSRQYLARQRLDPDGVLYKMDFCALDRVTDTVQKETHRDEDDSDLQALVDALNLPDRERIHYLFDHVDIPAIINYQAAATIIHDRDQGNGNYYLYRDPQGKDEWMFLPWDKDLTFGINYEGTLDLSVTADHDPQSHPLNCYKANDLVDVLYGYDVTREMFLRRLRTLMDELLQAPDTPMEQRHYEQRIDQLFAEMQLDVALDAARWHNAQGTSQTFSQAVRDLETNYLDARRIHLYETHGVDNGGIVPSAQPISATVEFGPIGLVTASVERDQEYLTLVNPNSFAVDLSGWTIDGPIQYRFAPGVVLPAGGTLYLSPNVVAFRNRAHSPTGGEGHFVQGNYVGRVSETGGLLRLVNAQGTLVDSRFRLSLGLLGRWSIAGWLVLLGLSVLNRLLRSTRL